ncbi:MAG: hypothetical protein COA70_03770 [Planctomycetota bacterium]|nr:MAG: hypothetical protein COA70_03770 [Planctomycetota bacterium]
MNSPIVLDAMILIYLARVEKLDWLGLIKPQPVFIGRKCAGEARYFLCGKERVLIDLAPLEQQGILQLTSICDDELPAYLEVIGMAKGLGEETEGLTLARCRGWRFVTTDKRALQFAAKSMPGHRS